MLRRLVVAVVVGFITWIAIFVIGALLIAARLPSVGGLLEAFAPLLGVLAALVYFFFGQTLL